MVSGRPGTPCLHWIGVPKNIKTDYWLILYSLDLWYSPNCTTQVDPPFHLQFTDPGSPWVSPLCDSYLVQAPPWISPHIHPHITGLTRRKAASTDKMKERTTAQKQNFWKTSLLTQIILLEVGIALQSIRHGQDG